MSGEFLIISVFFLILASAKVGNVVLVEVTDAGAKIKWDAVDGATKYRVSDKRDKKNH